MKNKKYALLLVAILLILPMTAAAPTIQFNITKIKTEPVPLQTAEYADIWLKVVNDGDTTAEDTVIRFTESYPFTVDEGDKTVWQFGDVLPGEEYRFRLQTRVDENAVHGTNELTFKTSTRTNNIDVTHTVPVEVRTDDAILAITNTSFPEAVEPGVSKQMVFTLENMADSQLRNIAVDLDLTDLPIGTAETTTKRLRKLDSGQTAPVSFTLQVDESADNGVYRIPITLTYENEAGTAFEKETATGLVVGGDPAIELALNENQLITAGSRTTATIRIVNRGLGEARFLKLTVEDGDQYEVLSAPTEYIGNMDADDFQTADVDLFIKEDAEAISLPITVAYRDATGEVVREDMIELPVYSQTDINRYSPGNGRSWMIPVVIVLVLVGAGIYYWRRRR